MRPISRSEKYAVPWGSTRRSYPLRGVLSTTVVEGTYTLVCKIGDTESRRSVEVKNGNVFTSDRLPGTEVHGRVVSLPSLDAGAGSGPLSGGSPRAVKISFDPPTREGLLGQGERRLQRPHADGHPRRSRNGPARGCHRR